MDTQNINENNYNENKPAESKPTYISVDEMAKILSIARVTAYQLTKTSGFPAFNIGKRIIIPLVAFHRWAEEQAANQAMIFSKGA